MAKTNLPVPQWLDQQWPRTPGEWEETIKKHWQKALFIVIAIYLIGQKDITIDFSFGDPEAEQHSSYVPEETSGEAQAMNVSMMQSATNTSAAPVTKKKKRKLTPEEEAKRKKQLAYVKRYAKIAQQEMETYGIPASITFQRKIEHRQYISFQH